MKIVHWAPFGPSRCGLYEAARDCVRADMLRGHDVLFCDTGATADHATREPVKTGHEDKRGEWTLRVAPYEDAFDADLWVCHDSIPDGILAQTQTPLVWMVHGRPLACFRPEQEGAAGKPYTLIANLAKWPRVKAIVTMWDEFLPHWSIVVPESKLRCTGDPPIELTRYPMAGAGRAIEKAKLGKVNALICDSWRQDVDVYEVAAACVEAARDLDDFRVHFWAVEPDKQTVWNHVWQRLIKLDALGEVHQRETIIDDVYRSMDMLVTPHVIGVRTIGEALSCGLPVVAAEGNRYAQFTGKPYDIRDMARAIRECYAALVEDPIRLKLEAQKSAQVFSLSNFGPKMEAIYREALDGQA